MSSTGRHCLQEWFEVPRMHELAASHAILRTVQILCPMKTMLEEVTDRVTAETHHQGLDTPVVPFMNEFLDFISDDERPKLRNKRWP